jgi:DNA repair exonuclease SbcCD ATPase subunit
MADQGDYYSRDLAYKDLGIDSEALAKSQGGGLNAQEAEHLRTLVLGLNEKLRSLQLLQHEVQNMRTKLHDSFTSRRTLQASIETTTKQLRDQADKQDQIHARLVRDREEAVDGLRRQHLQWKELCQQEEALESQLALANAELQKYSAEAENYAQMQAHIKRLQAEMQVSEQQRGQMKTQYLQSLKEFESRYSELQQSIDAVANNKTALQASLKEASTELADHRKRNDALASENLKLRSDISQIEGQVAGIASESRQLDHSHKLALEKEAAVERLQAALHKSSQSFEANLSELRTYNEELLGHKVDLDSQLSSLENELQEKTGQVNQLTQNKFQLVAELQTLEQLVAVRGDLEQINTALRSRADLNTSLQQQLLKELLVVSEYLLTLSDKTFSSHRAVLDLKDQLVAKEAEAQRLQLELEALQQRRVVYVADEKDETDRVLSAFVNSRDKELAVGFVWERPGMYRYGQKEVEVSVKEDKLKVKAGAGWLFIEEFVETYEALEAQKLFFRT